MDNWRRRCSSRRAQGTEHGRSVAAALPLIALFVAGCGQAADQTLPAGADLLCVPSPVGSLQARVQGSIDAEIDWSDTTPQCLGGVRPQGDGVRLLYRGSVPGTGPLLVLLGIAPLKPGESARNVPVNVTVVREGAGQFFATQGEDKCFLDSVQQSLLDDGSGRFRLEGRGFCTQPARAVSGDGAVLLSRFDVVAVIPASP